MQSMVTYRKKWAALLAASALLGTVAGCSGSDSGKGTGPAKTGAEKPSEPAKDQGKDTPDKLTVYNIMVYSEPPKADSDIVKKIQEYTGTKLEVTWIPNSTYREKINASIASGDVPMALMIDEKSSTMINAARSGMFWEIGPYLKDYPNLMKLNKNVLDSIKVDGKLYSLPRARSLVNDGPVFREDWMRKLGLSKPKTAEEFYNMIKAFALNDPDGNGKNDTYGLVEQKDMRGFGYLLALHGAPNEWEVKDGKLSPAVLTKEYLDAVKFYRRLYNEKLMNSDFAIINRDQAWDLINKNKAGLFLGKPDQITRFADLLKIEPNAEMGTFTRLQGAKGERILMGAGYYGQFFFSKTAVKTEAELKKVLKFFDKFADEKMQNLMVWGLEGVHYSLKDGKGVRNEAQTKQYNSELVTWYQGLQLVDPVLALPGAEAPLVVKARKAEKESEDIVVPNPAAAIISNTQIEKGAELDKIVRDAVVKFIMGSIDEADWEKALNQWKKSGGDKMIEEYNQEYAKIKK